jgi:hypothetical protein
MTVLGWVLIVVCGVVVLGGVGLLIAQDPMAFAIAIGGIAAVVGLCYGLHLIGVLT